MKKMVYVLPLVFFALFLAGCPLIPPPPPGNATNGTTVTPNVSLNTTIYPPANLSNATGFPPANFSGVSFESLGCIADERDYNCTAIWLEARFKCDNIMKQGLPAELANGYPTAECVRVVIDEESEASPYIIRGGGLRQVHMTYLLYDGNEFAWLSSRDQLLAFTGPIDTGPKALAYASLMTQDFANPAPVIPDFTDTYGKVTVYNSNPQPTTAEKTANGYKVNLYSGFSFGCHPEPYLMMIEYEVLPDGKITTLGTEKIYEGDSMICVD